MSNDTLGPRPSDPSKISFSRDCFEQVGVEEYYVVGLSAPRYPAEFRDRADAERFARMRNRSVTVYHRPILQRVKWF